MGGCISSNKPNKTRSQLKKSSTISINDPAFQGLFSSLTCPIENELIINSVQQVAKSKINIKIQLQNFNWRKVPYPSANIHDAQFWAASNWKNQSDTVLDHQTFLYMRTGKSEFLIAGMFNGQIDEKQDYYKFFKNGSYYFGKLNRELEPDGNGELHNCNNEVYTGEFRKGVPNGQGKLMTQDKQFEGIFKNGEKLSGLQISEKGEYSGEFKDNQRHGKGVLVLKSGVKYDGNFVKNKREGYGTLFDKDGNIVYKGEWSKDQMVSRKMR